MNEIILTRIYKGSKAVIEESWNHEVGEALITFVPMNNK